MAKHLYFDQSVCKTNDLTNESGKKSFLENECYILVEETQIKNSQEKKKYLEASVK